MKHRIRINLEGESSSLNLLDTPFDAPYYKME